MARHGYLREYDEGFERNEDRERGFMLGERERFRDRDEERFGPEHGYGGFQGDYSRGGSEQGGFGGFGDYSRGRTSFTSNPDDHYRSWRQKQIDALDRDYEDYCREREQQFHSDFDSWRRQRHGNPQPLQPGMTQSGLSADPSGTLQLETEAATTSRSEPDPMDTATLGTNTGGGRK